MSDVEITDEAVEAACRGNWDSRVRASGSGVPWDKYPPVRGVELDPYRDHMRTALAAALPHLSPLEALKPVVVDREAPSPRPQAGTSLRDALQILADHQAQHEGDHRLAAILAAYPTMAEPNVTREQVAEAMHNHQMSTHAWRQGCSEGTCIPIFLDRADAVLAALYPKATEGKS